MIKKFKEYIKESNIAYPLWPSTITIEDIEDQFLRIEEVLGCKIYILYDKVNYMPLRIQKVIKGKFKPASRSISVIVRKSEFPHENLNIDIEKVEDEIERIKNRMENMYPELEIIDFGGPDDLTSISIRDIIILLKKDRIV